MDLAQDTLSRDQRKANCAIGSARCTASMAIYTLDSEKTPSGEPTAYMRGKRGYCSALLIASLEGAQNVRVFAPDSVSSFETEDQQVEVSLRTGATLGAKLLVAADGRTSELRSMADPEPTSGPRTRSALPQRSETKSLTKVWPASIFCPRVPSPYCR